MGAWDIGPFDNDDAADFVADLSEMPAAGRAGRVRAALTLPDGYLQMDNASAAVAAAALLAAANGMAVAGHDEVDELVQSGTIPRDGEIRARASAALARVQGGDSEWSELWADGGSLAEATAVLDSIRLHL
jgi:Domain of unknown function (DUF4259)